MGLCPAVMLSLHTNRKLGAVAIGLDWQEKKSNCSALGVTDRGFVQSSSKFLFFVIFGMGLSKRFLRARSQMDM